MDRIQNILKKAEPGPEFLNEEEVKKKIFYISYLSNFQIFFFYYFPIL